MSEIPPGVGSELPDVDERLVAPASRYEIVDGQVVYVSPADEPHGTRHADLAAMVKAHIGDGFSVAVDMLTRTSRIDDIAPDVSVFPSARRPNGGRQLEQVAFEIASTESLTHAADKARRLVRRVLAIDLGRCCVVEWSTQTQGWSILDLGGVIADAVFAVPMPVGPLVDAARSDDAIVAAFRTRGHRAFREEREEGRGEGRAQGREEGREQGREEGRNEGRREILRGAILELLEVPGIAVSPAHAERIEVEQDLVQLERWRVRAKQVADAHGLFSTE